VRSNPNKNANKTVKFPTSAIPFYSDFKNLIVFSFREFRTQYLNPPYFSLLGPTLSGVPAKITFNSKFTVQVTIPEHVATFPGVKGNFIFLISHFFSINFKFTR
jgi:hypothetical protein